MNSSVICGYIVVYISADGGSTFGDGPPGQRDVGEVRVERDALRALALFPQVKGLREAAHSPHRIVQPVVQLCNNTRSRSVIVAADERTLS